MANSKRKCKECGIFTALESCTRHANGWFCSKECAGVWQVKKQQKDREKAYRSRTAELKRQHKQSDVKTRQKAAKEACHAYIRERDKGQPCICCGRPLGDEYHAGHWIPSGQNPQIRYDEDNIHGQRVDCNYFKGGDSGEYRRRLTDKIGAERVARLESMKGGTMKRTADDYAEIERTYKEKLKKLQNR